MCLGVYKCIVEDVQDVEALEGWHRRLLQCAIRTSGETPAW